MNKWGGSGEAEEPLLGEAEGSRGQWGQGGLEAIQRQEPDLTPVPEPGVAQHQDQGQEEPGAGHHWPGRVSDIQQSLTHGNMTSSWS